MCIENLLSLRQCQVKLVHLTFRSSLQEEPIRASNFNMFCIRFYGSCICMSKCMVSVILPSLTARYDSDSDIMITSGWTHGTHWQQGSSGSGGLNLKPSSPPLSPLQTLVRLASPRMSDNRPANRWRAVAFPNLNLSYLYHMVDFRNINASGAVVWTALQCAWDPLFEARTMRIFAKCGIRVYTDLYQDIQNSYAYLLSCISVYAFIRVCAQIYSVRTRIYGLVSVCTLSYLYLYILIYTEYQPVYTQYKIASI